MRPASFFLLAAALAAGSANAQTIVPNVEDGRIKAYTCTGCHGIEGWRNAYPSFRVPRIKGQNYEYLVQALNDYRAGTRRHTTMQAQGEAMSDQDIADIAAYLAGSAPSATAAATPVEARPADAGTANPQSE
jgi:cytochrome c553